MKTLKLLLFVLALSLPAWGLTNNGVSAPLQSVVGSIGVDCPAAIANAGGSSLGGTNGKAVATQLPTWASSADIDISGTFTATWSVYGSVDNITYRNAPGQLSANLSVASSGTTGTSALTINTVGTRYLCVVLTAYTSGVVVVTIEPRSAPNGAAALLTTGGILPVAQASGSAVNQASTSTSSVGTMMVPVADKSVVHQPVAATTASASAGAGGAAIRHIATSCTVYISTVAAQPDITVNLRDGGPSAGTIIWTGRVSCAITSGDQCKAQSPPLNIIGTANTAMTCETATAPAAGNLAVATLTYHDAG